MSEHLIEISVGKVVVIGIDQYLKYYKDVYNQDRRFKIGRDKRIHGHMVRFPISKKSKRFDKISEM